MSVNQIHNQLKKEKEKKSTNKINTLKNKNQFLVDP